MVLPQIVARDFYFRHILHVIQKLITTPAQQSANEKYPHIAKILLCFFFSFLLHLPAQVKAMSCLGIPRVLLHIS